MLRNLKNIKYNFLLASYNSKYPIIKRHGLTRITYRLKKTIFFYNKLRRLMIGRFKRVIKKKKITKVFWVNFGKIVFLFKKGLNMRMGGGSGSFFSQRRSIACGSTFLYYFSKRRGFSNNIIKQI